MLPVLDTTRKSTTTRRIQNSEDFLTGKRECWTLLFIIPSISQHSPRHQLSPGLSIAFREIFVLTPTQTTTPVWTPPSLSRLPRSFCRSLAHSSLSPVDSWTIIDICLGLWGPLPSLWPPLTLLGLLASPPFPLIGSKANLGSSMEQGHEFGGKRANFEAISYRHLTRSPFFPFSFYSSPPPLFSFHPFHLRSFSPSFFFFLFSF